MDVIDLKFLIDNLSSLCGIPTRIYKSGELIYYSSFITFKKDPIILDEKDILKREEHVGYYLNKSFFEYGFLNHGSYMIVVGPFRSQTPQNHELTKIAFNLELDKDDIPEFIDSMKMIISMPLSSIIQSLCMLNFILNGEKLAISDVIIDKEKALVNHDEIQSKIIDDKVDDSITNSNSAYVLEKEIERIVEHGEINELETLLRKAPSARSGILSSDVIRQYKNIFIVTATLASRAAIKGGLSQSEALRLSDLYIQKMELLSTIADIQTLQVSMIKDYTSLVSKIRGNHDSSELLINLNKYIVEHISNPISVNDICNALYISKSSLFEHVKKETGLTVSNYILQMKINESKTLLKYTSKNLATISIYLGFSSQSHFNRAFKKFTGTTPLQYKRVHK